jgi:hypothetical protein
MRKLSCQSLLKLLKTLAKQVTVKGKSYEIFELRQVSINQIIKFENVASFLKYKRVVEHWVVQIFLFIVLL